MNPYAIILMFCGVRAANSAAIADRYAQHAREVEDIHDAQRFWEHHSRALQAAKDAAADHALARPIPCTSCGADLQKADGAVKDGDRHMCLSCARSEDELDWSGR